MQIELRESKPQEIVPHETVPSPPQKELIRNPVPEESIAEQNTVPPAQTSPEHSAEEQEIKKVSNALEQFWKAMGVSLHFHVDEESNTIQVSIVDPSTNKVIRKIPSDEVLEMAASIRDTTGVFLDMDL